MEKIPKNIMTCSGRNVIIHSHDLVEVFQESKILNGLFAALGKFWVEVCGQGSIKVNGCLPLEKSDDFTESLSKEAANLILLWEQQERDLNSQDEEV